VSGSIAAHFNKHKMGNLKTGGKRFGLKQYSPRIEVKEELIEVVIQPNGTTFKSKIQLPDNQNLRFTHLMGMEVFHFADFPTSIVTKSTVLSEAQLKSVFITLQAYNGKNFVWQDPAICYHFNATVRENFPHVFAGQKLNYPKSYIELADATVFTMETSVVLPIRIFYREYDAVEKKDATASFTNQS
jgi:hypothetical protein